MTDLRNRIDGAETPTPAAAAKPRKHRLSAAGRAKIIRGLKRRWAAVKAAKVRAV